MIRFLNTIKEGGLFRTATLHLYIKVHTKNDCDRSFNSLAFCSIIKSSLLTFSCELSTIVQLGKPLGCVDSGTNFEWQSSQNMLTRLKFEQNTWTRLIFK